MSTGDGATSFDYVIVGAGSAGCVIAARLSADPTVSVLLVEAGPADDAPEIDVPILAPKLLGGPHDWGYRSEPEPGLDGRVMTLNHGRVVGGSSSINSMVYLRGTASDYDEWAGAGAVGWSYRDVLPYFRRSEDNERGADTYHGAGGPLPVSDGRSRHPLSAAFLRAAQQAGYPLNDDLNGATQEGVGYTQVTQRGGRRCSAARAYLGPCRSRPNLTLLIEAQVTALLFDGNRAAGVRVMHGSRPADYHADREVVLAAGAYGSPHLLLLAGIGPARHLEQMGVSVRQDLPAGRNLQDHLRVGLAFESRLPALDSQLTSAAFERFATDGSGPVSSNVGETSGFIRSRPERAAPDFQVNGVPAMIGGMLGVVADGVSVVGWPSKPTSSGYVELRSTDPRTPPGIVHNYLTTAEDREITCDGMRRMREIAEQPALREVTIGGPKLGPADFTDDAILRYARETGMTTHHPCGTCGIGSVVDTELRVFGVEGLRVADASVFPLIPRANINAATIMVGEKAADLLKLHKGCSSSMSVNLDNVDPAVIAKYALDRLPLNRTSTPTADLLSLRGVRAIVTGGGGEGLGNATCHRLAEQGARVAVVDVFLDAAEKTASDLAARWGINALAIATDVGDPDQVSAAVGRVVAAWGGIDLLVNNAGGSGAIKPSGARVTQHGAFLDMEIDDLLGVVRVNLIGVMLMTKAVLTPMIAAGRGRIINVASEGGKISVDGLAVYNACKSGVIGFTRNIARDYGKFGIAVTCVCPGIMVSERTIRTLSQPGSRGLASLESTFPRVTIGRASVPDEVASVIAFLASDAGSYVNGTAVSVGGGMAD